MKDNRIKEMQEYILLHQSVSLKELCDTFNVSMNTVRRYINEITADSAIKKVYGGVKVQSPVSPHIHGTEPDTKPSQTADLQKGSRIHQGK